MGAARRGPDVLDDAERARRGRIRASVDGLLRCAARRYALELEPFAPFWTGQPVEPSGVG